MTPVRLKTAAPRSRVKHSTTKLPQHIFWLVSVAEQVSLSQFEESVLGRSTLFAIMPSKIQQLVNLDGIKSESAKTI